MAPPMNVQCVDCGFDVSVLDAELVKTKWVCKKCLAAREADDEKTTPDADP